MFPRILAAAGGGGKWGTGADSDSSSTRQPGRFAPVPCSAAVIVTLLIHDSPLLLFVFTARPNMLALLTLSGLDLIHLLTNIAFFDS